jgi:hypothetical protein
MTVTNHPDVSLASASPKHKEHPDGIEMLFAGTLLGWRVRIVLGARHQPARLISTATATTCAAAGLHVGFHFHGYLHWVKFELLLS